MTEFPSKPREPTLAAMFDVPAMINAAVIDDRTAQQRKRRFPKGVIKRLALSLAVLSIGPLVGIGAAYVNLHWTEWRYAIIAALDCQPATDLRVETPDGRTVLLYECNTQHDVYSDD